MFQLPRRLSCLGTAVLIASPVLSSEIVGTARVLDGDTIAIGEARIRLHGIDAPERAQTCRTAAGKTWACGEDAARHLDRLIGSAPVTCDEREVDSYGRSIGTCSAGGRDLNEEMVRAGMAWAFVKYSTDFVAVEAEAREVGRGVFAAANEPPWEYRARRWESTRAGESAPRPDCPIKGNIARSGERVFHMPWQRDYARTKIDERRGERWFCDQGEAERAGWRPAAR